MSPIIGSFTSGRSFGRGGSSVTSYEATGGQSVVEPGDGYKYHYFTATQDFVVTKAGAEPIEVLMVGGGGGTSQYAGGAGGGEVITISRIIGPGTYTMSIGGGGSNGGLASRLGASTTGFGETAKPGAGGLGANQGIPGGGPQNGTYTPCGNGGAGSSRSTGYFGQQGTSVGSGVSRWGGKRGGQENSGTTNDAPRYPGGGGGGANQSRTGDRGGNGTGGPGGAGIQLSGVGLGYYWGGGGGGQVYYSGTGGQGGHGGGGAGGAGSPGNASNQPAYNQGGGGSNTGGTGGANTGGGGGGGRGQTGNAGGSGGSGIVIIRYPV